MTRIAMGDDLDRNEAAGTPPPPRFHLSPSAIARAFFHECERLLRFRATPKDRREADGVPPPPHESSPVTRAILDRGFAWEEQLVASLGKRVAIAPASRGVPLRDRQFDVAGTIAVLGTLQPGRFLYQGTLAAPPGFYTRHGLDCALVGMRENRPDLIHCVEDQGGRRLLRVLDVKASKALKLTHRIQVALYALQLRDVLEHHGIDAEVDLEHGGVWLTDAEEPELFDLGMIVPHVETFLSVDVPRILGAPAPGQGTAERPEPQWHVYFRCEWCEWFEPCRAEAEARKDLSLIPYLPTQAKRYLVKQGVTTLPQLGVFLQRNDAEATLGQCASLAGQRERLERHVIALDRKTTEPLGASSLAMPIREQVKIILTIQSEPVRGQAYAFGVLATSRIHDVREALALDAKAKVFVARTPGEVGDVRARALLHLHDVLERVDVYNGSREWKEQLGVQTYVYDGYELRLLVDALLGALDDPRVARIALALFSHFHDASLIQADKHRKVEVPFPVVVLTGVLRKLVALPTAFTYRLPDVLALLEEGNDRPFHYTPSATYQAPLSNVMKSDAIYAAWHGGETERIGKIEREIGKRLYAASGVVEGLRRRLDTVLFAWPPKFRLPEPHGIEDPTLSKLAFMAQYECAVSAVASQERRTRTRYERLHDGDAVALRPNRLGQLVVVDAPSAMIDASDFTTWLLSKDDRDGDREAMSFPDARWRNKHWGPRLEHAALVKVRESIDDRRTGFTRTVAVEPIPNGLSSDSIRSGERFLLQRRYTDYNADRLVSHLQTIDQEGASLVGWLTDRKRAGVLRALPRPIAAELAFVRDELDLLPSKARALDEVTRRALTLLWGPPGTGKTHFLAETVLALAVAHQRARQPLRVLVTAFTHAAIDNLLLKIASLREARGAKLPLAKVGEWRLGDAPDAIELVPKSEAAELAVRSTVLVGATAWSVLKMNQRFDLVIVDEASQLRVPDATIPLHAVSAAGRVILAGDHLQLPPIVQADYPDPEPGAPLLHRSVFEAMQVLDDPPPSSRGPVSSGRGAPSSRRGPTSSSRRGGATAGPPLTAKLLENFRMNDVLTGFAARHLYGAEYRCATASVAEARLPWATGKERPRRNEGAGTAGAEAEELVRFALDPAYPMVLVMLDGVFAARSNPVEAEIVADLVMALRQGLRDADGRRYRDTEAGDAAFFRDGVFVTCPHHAQIHAVRHALARRREWQSRPFVDTVDRMQGQEAQVVIASYGVSDPDFALQEAEFIYSRNRLNVAMTRARTKAVVCLPRGLVEGAAQVVESEEAAKGLAFMRALWLEAQRRGEGRSFAVGEGAEAHVWRMG